MAQDHRDLVKSVLPGKFFFIYEPALAYILGTTNEAILICYLLYWHGKGSRKGYTYKTAGDMELETGLSANKQRTAIEESKQKGFLEVRNMGVPSTRHFKLDVDALIIYITSSSKTSELVMRLIKNSDNENQQTITESNKDLPEEVNTIYRLFLTHNDLNEFEYKLTPARRRLLIQRLLDLGFDRLSTAVVNCASNAFYNGSQDDGVFIGTLDFICKTYETAESLSIMRRN